MNKKKYAFIKKTENILFWIAAGASCFIISSLLITGKISGKPNVLGYRTFMVASPSMEPTIMTNQMILAKAIDADEVKEGDIIAYQTFKGGKIIVHRVIEINEENGEKQFIFKGDNNKTPDPIVYSDSIKYKIVKY